MGISGNICCREEKKYKSIKSQFNNIQLLIGLQKNEDFTELNSVLQCLCNIKPLADYFKYKFDNIKQTEFYKKNHKNDKCLTESFNNIIDKIWPNDFSERKRDNNQELKIFSKTENSREFLEKIKNINEFNENNEFLINYIIKRFHMEANKVVNSNQTEPLLEEIDKKSAFKKYVKKFEKENKSIISDNFYGTYYTKTYCTNCNNNFFIFNAFTFSFYSLDIVYNNKCTTILSRTNLLYKNNMFNLCQINIYDCLYYDMQSKNKIQICKKCAMQTNLVFQNIIYASPKIITFIFKRNIFLPTIQFIIEENINIDFFVEQKNNKNYFLIGMIFNVFENHFVSYCKSPIDNNWYSYDDEKVEKKDSFQQILMNNMYPYILLYQIKEETIN